MRYCVNKSEPETFSLCIASPCCSAYAQPYRLHLCLKIKTDSLFTSGPSNMANEMFKEIISEAAHLKALVKIF